MPVHCISAPCPSFALIVSSKLSHRNIGRYLALGRYEALLLAGVGRSEKVSFQASWAKKLRFILQRFWALPPHIGQMGAILVY
jgi:hypothetical protein